MKIHIIGGGPAGLYFAILMKKLDPSHEIVFQPSIDLRQNRYTWLGTHQAFSGLTMGFRQADAGLFIYHAYRFSPDLSTFIVECAPEVWLRAGLDQMSEADTLCYLEDV